MNSCSRIVPTFFVETVSVLLLLVMASVDAQAVSLRWMRTYNGSADKGDVGHGVAVAADGSVYVTGFTGAVGQGWDLLLRKYAPAGTLLWSRTYNGPKGSPHSEDSGLDVAVAANGDICVAGYTYVWGQTYNLLLRKYSSGGAPLWTKTYNGAMNDGDRARGVAFAPDGSVYVVGSTNVAGQWDNMLLRKYSPGGSLVWSRTHNGAANGSDEGYGVAVAPDGNVYVTGYAQVADQFDLLLWKYSPGGSLVWTRNYNGSANYWDVGFAVAVAQDSSVYVTGYTNDVAGEGPSLLLQKYSAGGSLQWTRVYDGITHGGDFGQGVAVAVDGGVFVTGSTQVAGQSCDLILLKYSPGGSLLWTKTYDGAAHACDRGLDTHVAADGSVYVTGHTFVLGQGNDLLLQKYK